MSNLFKNLAEEHSELFVWVLFGVPAAVVVVAMLVTWYALAKKAKGNVTKNEEHKGILQALYEAGESEQTVIHLSRGRRK